MLLQCRYNAAIMLFANRRTAVWLPIDGDLVPARVVQRRRPHVEELSLVHPIPPHPTPPNPIPSHPIPSHPTPPHPTPQVPRRHQSVERLVAERPDRPAPPRREVSERVVVQRRGPHPFQVEHLDAAVEASQPRRAPASLRRPLRRPRGLRHMRPRPAVGSAPHLRGGYAALAWRSRAVCDRKGKRLSRGSHALPAPSLTSYSSDCSRATPITALPKRRK